MPDDDDISVGQHSSTKKKGNYPFLKSFNRQKSVKSFCIDDILSYKTAALAKQVGQKVGGLPAAGGIVRPWDGLGAGGDPSTAAELAAAAAERGDDSPLDALFNMASNFEAMKTRSEMERAQLSLVNKAPSKKKRKSRTAFTNHQIFELEKRFLYQKYLSPADRDEIAAQLGLTNAQVICWFQNRRAKFKRDMEELKKDVEKTPLLPGGGGGGAPGGGGGPSPLSHLPHPHPGLMGGGPRPPVSLPHGFPPTSMGMHPHPHPSLLLLAAPHFILANGGRGLPGLGQHSPPMTSREALGGGISPPMRSRDALSGGSSPPMRSREALSGGSSPQIRVEDSD